VPKTGLPINRPIQKLLSEKPNEIYRGREAEIFKSNLNEVQTQISELENCILKGIDKIKEHCNNLRKQVQQAANDKFEEMNRLTATLIYQINTYEKECIQNAIDDEEYKTSFDQRITVISKFIEENKNFLYQCNISEGEIIQANEMFKVFKGKLDEEMTNINDFTFNYSLMEFEAAQSKIPENAVGSLCFRQLGKAIGTNQLKKFNLKECVNDLNKDSLVLTEVGDWKKYYIAYFNSKNEVIITAYDHVDNIKFEKNIISDCRSIYQIKKIGNSLAVCYQKENAECCIVFLDEELNITHQNNDFCQMLIGQNDDYFYCFNPLNKTGIKVYDWNLNQVELNQAFQTSKPSEPFYFSDDIKHLEHRGSKYIWLDSLRLNIMNDKTGEIIKSLSIAADDFEVDSKENIICLVRSEFKLKYFDLFGVFIKEIDLNGFNMESDFTFRLDKNDKMHFFEELNVYF